jgi:hypothetical protein
VDYATEGATLQVSTKNGITSNCCDKIRIINNLANKKESKGKDER